MNVTPLVIASYVVSAEQPSGVKLPSWEIYIGQRGLQHCRKADMYRHFVTLSSSVGKKCPEFRPDAIPPLEHSPKAQRYSCHWNDPCNRGPCS